MNNSRSTFVRTTFSVYRRLTAGGLALIAGALLSACQPTVPDSRDLATGAASAPTKVSVVRVSAASIDGATTQVARVEAAQRVELQPRVSGPIEVVLFREGELVRAGQPLFQIDPRPYDATVARARAELRLAIAREQLTAAEAERAKKLRADRAIAMEDLERRVAAHAEAQARRAAAEAALQTAQLDRDFTLVRSPIDARIGRALVTPGNFVSAGSNPTPLASLVSVSPLHVHLDVADRQLLTRLRESHGAKGWRLLILEAEGGRELADAPVDFTDHSVDPATGTVRLRARVDAPATGLMPGQYVRARIVTGTPQSVLLIPDAAIGSDQGTRFVLVVGDSGRVEYRRVRTGAAQGSERIVTDGVEAGEQVVVSGLMRVRPGMVVQPVMADDTVGAEQVPAVASTRS